MRVTVKPEPTMATENRATPAAPTLRERLVLASGSISRIAAPSIAPSPSWPSST